MNKKRLKFGLFFILILILSIIIVITQSEDTKIDPYINKELEKNNETKVIIIFKKPALEEGIIFKKNKTKEQIEKEKIEIRDNIKEKINKNKINHEFDDSIALTISKKELENLNINKDIESIIIDKPLKAFLADSVPLINATRVWSIKISGQNITGINETICVLDTGVNFTHPDLRNKNKTCIIDCVNKACVENCSISDDNGHGTHVAGIVAASSKIDGVAIGSNLIGVKVMNSAATGSSADLRSGINWCINNSVQYNISVMSISLGTDCVTYPQWCYNEYCDYDEPLLASSIDNAVSNNISVIIASGNRPNYTHISDPACIKNATAIARTNKDDSFYTGCNRNSLVDLVAPGTNINSTNFTGRYSVMSGTSMSAPHVAGAFALIRQFGRLNNNRALTPIEIQNIFNSTGVRVYDSQSGLYFSRINVYDAILSIDNIPPNVSLDSPQDNSNTYSRKQTFECNSSDLQLSNVTFYLWKENNLVNTTTLGSTGEFASLSFNISNIDSGNYSWNCLSYDRRGNYAFSYANYSFVNRLPVFGVFHSLHTTISDGTQTQSQRVNNLKSYYDFASTIDHDTQINSSEWDLTKTEANSNNTDNNFTYFVGYEWRGSSANNSEISTFFLDNGPATKVNGTDSNYDNFLKFSLWLQTNNGIGCINHPARVANVIDWNSTGLNNQSYFPCVEIINKQYFHWNNYWNCSNDSGCSTYANPSPDGSDWNGSVKNALDNGLKLGFVAGWDYHSSTSEPNAYTGIVNPENWTRAGIYDSIRRRHTWASQNKTLMNVKCYNGFEDFVMGDEFNYSSTSLNITIMYIINATTGTNVTNISLFLNGIIRNITFSNQQNVKGNFSIILENNSNNYIFIEAVQSNNQRAFSSPMYVYSILLEEPPIIYSLINSQITSTSATISWNTNENSNHSLNYGTTINLGSIDSSSSYSNSHSVLLSGLTSSTTFYYNITVCDISNNCVTNGTFNFTTSAASNSGSNPGGGGGGGVGYKTFSLEYKEFLNGFSRELGEKDRIKFSLSEGLKEYHYIINNKINKESVNITVSSELVNFILNIGEIKKFNLSSPYYYDLYIKLISIKNDKINLSIKKINENITNNKVFTIFQNNSDINKLNENILEKEKPIENPENLKISIYFYLIVILSIIILIVISLIIKETFNNKKRNNILDKYKEIFNQKIIGNTGKYESFKTQPQGEKKISFNKR